MFPVYNKWSIQYVCNEKVTTCVAYTVCYTMLYHCCNSVSVRSPVKEKTAEKSGMNGPWVVFQVVEVIEPQRRDQRIDELLQKYHKTRKNRVIVFVLYKKEASRVEAQLGKKGWKVRAAAPRAVAV